MKKSPPNIILIMCDDLGYGDVGFNGNRIIQTPCLDTLCAEGARFTRFYAGGPVCSPTRGTCLTGRHYSRYGVTHANAGRLPVQEISLARMCKDSGFRTGHFGKWHLGTMSKEIKESLRGGPDHPEEFSPPWLHGFDVCFSTEAKVPTWDPMVTPDEKGRCGFKWGEPGTPFGTHYWDQQGRIVNDNLDGDDSRVIMDRVLPFIQESHENDQPFLAVVWFHTPHTPVVAGPEYRALYAEHSEEEQHYYGCVTAMDEQVGRLNDTLKSRGLDQNTLIAFCSDNGPEGGLDLSGNDRNRGVTGGLRGRKRSLFNGGIGVPALLKWPERVKSGSEIEIPCSTLDYFPTVLDVLEYTMPDDRPIDGVNLMPLIEGQRDTRPAPIPYRFLESEANMFGAPTLALIEGRFKFLTNLSEDGSEDMLFDLDADIGETTNLIHQKPDHALAMRKSLSAFISSCRESHHGHDYPDGAPPINAFQEITGTWQ